MPNSSIGQARRWLRKAGVKIRGLQGYRELAAARAKQLGLSLDFPNKEVARAFLVAEFPPSVSRKRRPGIAKAVLGPASVDRQSAVKFAPPTGAKVDPGSTDFLKTIEWRRIRYDALKLRGGRCQCCGASPATGAVLNVDHVLPRKTHPHLALTLSNLQVLCADCNAGKGNRDKTDWRNSADARDLENSPHVR